MWLAHAWPGEKKKKENSPEGGRVRDLSWRVGEENGDRWNYPPPPVPFLQIKTTSAAAENIEI